RPVVQRLLELCRLRNTVPAFDGPVEVTLDGARLTMVRRGEAQPEAAAILTVDLASGAATVAWQGPDGSGHVDVGT
ncbi:MAG: sucrose phosphorylase, partial [Cellulomonadaceae bacterium]